MIVLGVWRKAVAAPYWWPYKITMLRRDAQRDVRLHCSNLHPRKCSFVPSQQGLPLHRLVQQFQNVLHEQAVIAG